MDHISKFTHVVVHGLVEKITTFSTNRTKIAIAFLKVLAPLDCRLVLEVYVILFWYTQLFFDNNKDVEEPEGRPAPNNPKTHISTSASNFICH